VLIRVQVRTVAQDCTVRWAGAACPIRRSDIGGGMRGQGSGDRTAVGSDGVDALAATAFAVGALPGGKESQLSGGLDSAPVLWLGRATLGGLANAISSNR
jgi:hypothetical protein